MTIPMKPLQKYFYMVLLRCNLLETEVWYFLEDSFQALMRLNGLIFTVVGCWANMLELNCLSVL